MVVLLQHMLVWSRVPTQRTFIYPAPARLRTSLGTTPMVTIEDNNYFESSTMPHR